MLKKNMKYLNDHIFKNNLLFFDKNSIFNKEINYNNANFIDACIVMFEMRSLALSLWPTTKHALFRVDGKDLTPLQICKNIINNAM